MTRQPFLNAFNASGLPRSIRLPISATVVPRLVTALANEAVEVKVSRDLRDLAALYEKHRGRMKRLAEPCNPEFQHSADASNTLILIAERHGEGIGAICLRLKWLEDSLAESFRSQTLFFDDPQQIPKGHRLIVTAPQAFDIKSCHIAFSCGTFVQEGEDPVIFKAMARLMYLWTFAEWKWSHLVGLCEDAIAQRFAFDTLGFNLVGSGVEREEAAGVTYYRLVTASRNTYRRLIGHSTYGDLDVPLGRPSVVVGEGA